MPYQVTLSNGSVLLNITDNTLDTSTSLTLVGKNFLGYGTAIADNFVRLLENAANATPPGHPLVGQLWYDSQNALMKVWSGSSWVSLAGGVTSILGNTGAITLSQMTASGLAPIANPSFTGFPQAPTASSGTTNNQLATTSFVTNAISSLSTGVTSVLGNGGTITLNQLLSGGLAPIISPTFLGTPNAPTASIGNSSTQIATTAFVINQVGALSTGVQSVLGSGGTITLSQMVAGGLAPLTSPAFAGNPQAPTQAQGSPSNSLATTSYVATAVSNVNLTLTSSQVTGALGFNPVQQGGTSGQNSNKVFLGWDGFGLRCKIDSTDQAYVVTSTTAPNAGLWTVASRGVTAGGAVVLTGAPSSPSITIDNFRNFFRVFNTASGSFVLEYDVTTGELDGVGALNATTVHATTVSGTNINAVTAMTANSATFNTLVCNGSLAVGATITGTSARLSVGGSGTGDGFRVLILADFGLVYTSPNVWYSVFPTGFIIQQSVVNVAANTVAASLNVTFPLAFPHSCMGVIAGFFGTPTAGSVVTALPASQSQVALTYISPGGAVTLGVSYIAFGF